MFCCLSFVVVLVVTYIDRMMNWRQARPLCCFAINKYRHISTWNKTNDFQLYMYVFHFHFHSRPFKCLSKHKHMKARKGHRHAKISLFHFHFHFHFDGNANDSIYKKITEIGFFLLESLLHVLHFTVLWFIWFALLCFVLIYSEHIKTVSILHNNISAQRRKPECVKRQWGYVCSYTAPHT